MKKGKFERFFKVQDVLNHTLKFLPLYKQIKIIFLNKTILDYYLKGYHGVFNGSLKQIHRLLKSLKKLGLLNEKKTKQIIFKNISCINYYYGYSNKSYLLQNLKPHIINYYGGINHSYTEFLEKVKEIKVVGLQKSIKNLVKFKNNLYLNKLKFIKVLAISSRKRKIKRKICVNCKELFFESSDIDYLKNLFLFKNVKKLYLKSIFFQNNNSITEILNSLKTIEKLVLENVVGDLKITNFINLRVFEIKNSNIPKEFFGTKRLKVYSLKDVFWLLKKSNNIQINTLNLENIEKDWNFGTYAKKNEFFNLLKCIKNLIIKVPLNEDPYLVFRQCVKIEGLVELKLQVNNNHHKKSSIEKIKKVIKKYYKKIKILIINIES